MAKVKTITTTSIKKKKYHLYSDGILFDDFSDYYDLDDPDEYFDFCCEEDGFYHSSNPSIFKQTRFPNFNTLASKEIINLVTAFEDRLKDYQIDAKMHFVFPSVPYKLMSYFREDIFAPYFLEIYSYSFDAGFNEVYERCYKCFSEVLSERSHDLVAIKLNSIITTGQIRVDLNPLYSFELYFSIGFLDANGDYIAVRYEDDHVASFIKLMSYKEYHQALEVVKKDIKVLNKLKSKLSEEAYLNLYENQVFTPFLYLYLTKLAVAYQYIINGKEML